MMVKNVWTLDGERIQVHPVVTGCRALIWIIVDKFITPGPSVY